MNRRFNSILAAAAAAALLVGCAGSTGQQGAAAGGAVVRQARLKPRAVTITEVHAKHSADLRNCFESAAAQTDADDESKVEVELRLPASGTPTSIRLLGAWKLDPTLRQCLEQVLAGLEYGESRRGATYYQVMRFDPASRTVAFEKPVTAYRRWGLTRREMKKVLVAHGLELEHCYALAADAPSGRVVLTIAVSAAGPPARVGLKSSTLESPEADLCLVESVLKMDFPKPRGSGVTVRDIPLHFNGEEGWIEPTFKKRR
jgi:hypothetical protein